MNGMESGDKRNTIDDRIKQLETQISELKFEVEEKTELLKQEQEKRQFYQLVADFTFGWELWFDPSGKINFCSPSCLDLTGYTANQILESPSLSGLLVYVADREKFEGFLHNALNQNLINPSLEFRLMTRTRQMRWCLFTVRGVYNREGRYLGIRGSVQDITKLKKALGRINDLSTGKELENRNRQRLKSELEIKERELVTFLMQLSQKNELIAKLTQQLKLISADNLKNGSDKIQKLLHLLENNQNEPVDWSMIEIQLEKLHPGFMNRLLLKHPKLTAKDKKLCACLKLGLTSKQIAGLNNLSPQSVEVTRVRLRKKLKITHETRLVNYLAEI
jgi:PAS domain S-box-containing protein